MKLLILGGTRFIGRHLAEAALAAGHQVTLFHRGRHSSGLDAEVETLHGDRGGDLAALRGRRWEAVIDTSGYAYPEVRRSAELLADAVELYLFVSTISVYADFSERGITEESRLHTPDRSSGEVTGRTYGPMKVACEEAVREVIPERQLIVRPCIVVGPHDYTDRFPYWCRRIAAGGEVLAPGDPERPVQYIDGRDLAEWMLRQAEARRTGTFNTAGPAAPLTMNGMLAGIRAALGSDARFTWVADDLLERERVYLPFWVPEENAGIHTVDASRAIAAGLTFRPLSETARDTLAWDRAELSDAERTGGIPREREAELLRTWHERA